MRYLFTLLLALFIFNAYAQNSGLVYPKGGQVLSDTNIKLKWNKVPNDSVYQITLAKDSLFQNKILNDHNSQFTNHNLLLTSNQTYYWHVKYITQNQTFFSDTLSFTVFNPKDIDSLVLWLTADSLVSVDSTGNVSQWSDLSGNSNDCFQNNYTDQPTYQDSIWLDHSGIYFDNDNLLGSLSDSINFLDQSLFFIEMNDGSQNRQTPFGYYVQNKASYVVFDFEIWSNNGRFTLWFGDLNSYEASHNNLNLTNRFELAELIIKDNHNVNLFRNSYLVNDFTISKEPGKIINYILGSRYPGGNELKGFIPEVFVYNQAINDFQRKLSENYLLHKYTPPTNLGPNIVRTHSFCDTTLTTSHKYESYLWSTGDTTRSISISRKDTGWYWVEAPNLFDEIVRDSIYVYDLVPGPGLEDTTICLGTQSEAALPYSHEYSFNWSDGSADSVLKVSQPGQYTVTVTDSLGCSITDTVNVKVDSFALEASLGPDKSVCTGDKLFLQSGGSKAQDFSWSTGSQDSLITIDTAGTYSVTVTDTNQCTAYDTIDVSIRGITPVVGFTMDSVCYGQPTVFQDTSYTKDSSNIISKTWEFGDNSLSHSVSSSQSHKYDNPGEYTVKLTATTDSNCTNYAYRKAWVHPLPEADFKPLTACSRHDVQFEDRSQETYGQLQQWNWNFNDPASQQDTSVQQEPVYNYSAPGEYEVQQVVTDEYGCRDTAEQKLNIRPTPEADFAWSNTCNGDPLYFTSEATANNHPIITHQWAFNSQDSSFQKNPSFLFDSAGTYPVRYYVRAVNGCWDTITQNVPVHPLPQAGFAMQDYCLGDTAVFTDSSTVEQGNIAKRQWDFGNGTKDTGALGKTVFHDTLTYPVSLYVQTDNGCTDSIVQQAKVHPVPQANFTADILYGLPPLEVNFTNSSAGAESYFWDFGDNATATQASPSHIYQDTGVYTARMTAYNQYGCMDSADTTVHAVYEPVDIVLSAGFINYQDGYVHYQCRVYNNSNRPVQKLQLEAGLNNVYSLRESWEGILKAGESLNFNFSAQTPIDKAEDIKLFCFRATPDIGQDDVKPGNNEYCKEFTNELYVSEPYPNPAGEKVNLDVILPYAQTVEVQMHDSKGNKVDSFQEDLSKGLNKLEYSTVALQQGVYFLQLRFEGEQRIVKVVK